MEDVKEVFSKKICIFCLNHECKIEKKCENFVYSKKNDVDTYKCLNFVKKYCPPKEFSEFIRYAFYDEDGKYIVIIKPDTPKFIYNQMKFLFDDVKYRE